MNESIHTLNEQAAAKAFSKQAPLFDELYSADIIIQYKRQRVRAHVLRNLQPASTMLELNAGTGEDAVFFAGLGHSVHATDISVGMQAMLKEKVQLHNLESHVTTEACSFTELESLINTGPFDIVFSNFAGLNCTAELSKVLRSLSNLVKPGGLVTLVMLPKFCLWEFLLLFRGKFKTAFRRFAGRKGARAHIEGELFRCWYYSPAFVKRQLKESFSVVSTEGLCTVVPPSYLEKFAEKHPKVFNFLKRREDKWKDKWPWRNVGDYYIITLKKEEA